MDPQVLLEKANALQAANQKIERLVERRTKLYRDLFDLDNEITRARDEVGLARNALMAAVRTDKTIE